MKKLEQYEFFAFISYKREDEKWAKWLQHKLEYYKLPSSVRKDNSNLPDKIRPVFKDTTDLEPGVLAQKIQDALNSSKFLIVICSPRSANSIWVSKEVQSFIDSGRADHIIPFIIGGTPNASDPKDECLPEELRQLAGEQELLGANINEMGREAAAIKVVARMFNLRFDTLWRRYEKAKKFKRLVIGIALSLIIGIVIIIAAFIVNQNILLEQANSKLNVANISIRMQKDSIQQAKNDIALAYDSLMKSKKELIETQINLENTNNELAKTNGNLSVANQNLRTEQQLVMEKDQEITKGFISLLITSAKEQYTRGEYLMANQTISKAIDYMGNNNIVDSKLRADYERIVRLIDRIWEEPGIRKLNTISIPNNLYGTFSDDQIIIPNQNNTVNIWNFMSGSSYYITNPARASKYIHTALESFGVYKKGKYIEHRDSVLRVVESQNSRSIGYPLTIGYGWLGIKYKFGIDNDKFFLAKDSTLYIYDYHAGTLDTIIKLKCNISDFSQSPDNKNLVAVVTNDSCVSTINVKNKKIINRKKFDSNIKSISFHPGGNYLSVAGDNIILTNTLLDILAKSNSDHGSGFYMSMFNSQGDKIYSCSYEGVHTVWSVGFMPYNYRFLSNNGKYGVIYRNKEYRLYDYEKREFIPGVHIKDVNEEVLCFGNRDSTLITSQWNSNSGCYTFSVIGIDSVQKKNLHGIHVKKNKYAYMNDYNATLYVASNDTLISYGIYNGETYIYTGMEVKKMIYSKTLDCIFIQTLNGSLYKASNNLANINEVGTDIANVNDFDIDSYGNVYISDTKGYLYYFGVDFIQKKYIGIADNVNSISVDKEGFYLLTHSSYNPKYEFYIDVRLYGHNIVSDTKIWDVKNRQIIEDLSSYKLSDARIINDFTGNILIDTGNYWLPFSDMTTLEKRIKNTIR